MKHYKKLQLILLLSFGIIIYSCHKDDDFLTNQNTSSEVSSKSELSNKNESFKGAKKLKNPYALKNMQKALENIKKKLATKEIKTKGDNAARLEEGVLDFELSTSHYYVKLIPQNAEEESLLKADPSILAFDYPLDYEFTDEYLDNRTPDNDSIPEYYTSIVLGQELPAGVPYEILEELYIPEQDPFFDDLSYVRTSNAGTRQGEIGNNEDLLRHLLIEAFTLTGNESELLPEGDITTAFWIFGSKWYPSGNLKLWDDNAGSSTTTTQIFSHWEYYNCDTGEIVPDPNNPYPIPLKSTERIDPIDENTCQRAVYTYSTNTIQGKYVPLEGAQVLMRQWFTIRQGITDANGNFSTGSVRGAARYIIQWERHNYSIRNGWLNQAEKRGPKENNTAWNYSIKDGVQEFYGTIHHAAHHYYYKDIKGLRRPPLNSFWKTQLKIRAYNETNNESYGNHKPSRRFLGLGSNLKIYNPQRESMDLYGTVIHELAHASHWNMDKSNYNTMNYCDETFLGLSCSGDTKIAESWARGVQWELTRMIYPSYGGGLTILPDYTQIVVDMVDINYSSYSSNLNNGLYNDNVSGYTIREIEDALNGEKTWDGWKNNIKNKYNNGTENNLDALFNYWGN